MVVVGNCASSLFASRYPLSHCSDNLGNNSSLTHISGSSYVTKCFADSTKSTAAETVTLRDPFHVLVLRSHRPASTSYRLQKTQELEIGKLATKMLPLDRPVANSFKLFAQFWREIWRFRGKQRRANMHHAQARQMFPSFFVVELGKNAKNNQKVGGYGPV